MLCLRWGFYSSHVSQKSPERDATSALTKQTACKLADRFTDNSPEPNFHSAHGDLSGRGEFCFFCFFVKLLPQFSLLVYKWARGMDWMEGKWNACRKFCSVMLIESNHFGSWFPSETSSRYSTSVLFMKKGWLFFFFFFLDHLKIRLSPCCPNLPDRCVSFYQMDVFWQ